jgi:hypothetical protein
MVLVVVCTMILRIYDMYNNNVLNDTCFAMFMWMYHIDVAKMQYMW